MTFKSMFAVAAVISLSVTSAQTPLKTELRFRAWLDRVEGRKVYTKGELYAGDLLVAKSHGVFIAITFEKFAALEEDRKRRGV